MTQAQDLTLPQRTADPVILHIGQDAPQADMLKVFVQGAETPVAGRFMQEGGTVSFAPAFGFEPGQNYEVRVIKDGEESSVPFRISLETPPVPAVVTEIYPSGDQLPENTLRFYLHFSVPMQPSVAFDYITLRDANGAIDEAAFMRFKQELWNEDRTRLTVLIDPGRIKREVATNVALGPALLSGETYTIAVEAGWPSADGSTVLPAFTKTFHVSGALRTRPDVGLWSLSVPCAGRRDPLIVTLDRPFDRHQLDQSIYVENAAGDRVAGLTHITADEQTWLFIPDQPWPAGHLWLRANTTLEDVAGNNFNDLLDHVAEREESDAAKTEVLIRTHICRS